MTDISVQDQLSNIASFAYGSGALEKTNGGRGNIALIDGHVVKFNTHFGKRDQVENAREACNALRTQLYSIARSRLQESGLAQKDFDAEIKSIRKKLGLGEDGQTVVSKKLLARKVVADVIRRIDAHTKVDSFADMKAGDLVAKLDLQGVSDVNRAILKDVLKRQVADASERGGAAAKSNLQGPGSAFDSIKKLIASRHFSMRMASLAQSLPPNEAKAFLRACLLVPDVSFGTVERFYGVSSELAKLEPSKFTPESIMKLADSSVEFPDDLKRKTGPLNESEMMILLNPYPDQQEQVFGACMKAVENREFDQKSPTYLFGTKSSLFLNAGVSKENLDTCWNDLSKFTLKMLPQGAFFPSNNQLDAKTEAVVSGLKADIKRNHLKIKFLDSDGKTTYTMPDILRYEESKSQKEWNGFSTALTTFCGDGNAVQEHLVRLFLSQNTMTPETLMCICHGKSEEDAYNTQYLLKTDPATGDIYASKTTAPENAWGMSVTIRIGRDGSMSLVDLQERTKSDTLVPLDGKGRPMSVEQSLQPLTFKR